MKKIISFIFATIFLLSFSSLVLAQTQFQWPVAWDVNNIANVLGISADMLRSPSNFIFLLLVPFIAVWSITLGFLKQLRIFPRTPSIEIIISFTMAFATLPSGILNYLVSYLLAFSGGFAAIMFFVMFLGGVFLYTIHWPGFTFRAGGLAKDIDKLTREINDLDRKIANPGSPTLEEQYRQLRARKEEEKKRKQAELDRIYAHQESQYGA